MKEKYPYAEIWKRTLGNKPMNSKITKPTIVKFGDISSEFNKNSKINNNQPTGSTCDDTVFGGNSKIEEIFSDYFFEATNGRNDKRRLKILEYGEEVRKEERYKNVEDLQRIYEKTVETERKSLLEKLEKMKKEFENAYSFTERQTLFRKVKNLLK